MRMIVNYHNRIVRGVSIPFQINKLA